MGGCVCMHVWFLNIQCADFSLQRINQTVRPKTKNWKAYTVVCHGSLATRAEEVKTEIAVIFLYLRISTLYAPCSLPPKHTFWFLQVVVHWIKYFIYFNDFMFDSFYLWRIRGITYWVQNFRASVDTSLIDPGRWYACCCCPWQWVEFFYSLFLEEVSLPETSLPALTLVLAFYLIQSPRTQLQFLGGC